METGLSHKQDILSLTNFMSPEILLLPFLAVLNCRMQILAILALRPYAHYSSLNIQAVKQCSFKTKFKIMVMWSELTDYSNQTTMLIKKPFTVEEEAFLFFFDTRYIRILYPSGM